MSMHDRNRSAVARSCAYRLYPRGKPAKARRRRSILAIVRRQIYPRIGHVAQEIADNFDASPPLALSIEDHGLAPVPAKVAAAIKRNATHYGACKLIGEPILPSLGQNQPTYFVTTADAYDWGAALGPVWIVAMGDNGQARAIVNSGGYWMRVAGGPNTPFTASQSARATAGARSGQGYGYDGGIYREN